jgi:spore coat protein U-like protein
MGAATATLDYQLYVNTARTTVWGDGTGGTATVQDGYLLGVGSETRSYPVLGRIPGGQNVPVGSYADSIVVTVDF